MYLLGNGCLKKVHDQGERTESGFNNNFSRKHTETLFQMRMNREKEKTQCFNTQGKQRELIR